MSFSAPSDHARMYPFRNQAVPAAILLLAATVTGVLADPALDQYAIGAGHYTRGRWQMAAAELRTFVRVYPRHEKASVAKFFLGEALVQLGEYDGARDCFREFLETAPQHKYARQALFRMGETGYLTGQSDEARRRLTQFRQLYPGDPLEAYVLPYLADVLLSAGDARGAAKLYADALDRFGDGPLNNECRFGLARAMEIQGDAAGAARFYRYLTQDVSNPLADDAQLQLGLMQYNAGSLAEAVESFEAFQGVLQESPFRPQARYWLGVALLAQRNFSAAAQTLTKAAAEHSGHPLAPAMSVRAADALLEDGKFDEALRQYEQTLSNWPGSQWTDDCAAGRVEVAFRRDDFKAAASLAERFYGRHPQSPLGRTVRRTWGRSLLKLQRYEEAVSVLEAPANVPSDVSPETANSDKGAPADASRVEPGGSEETQPDAFRQYLLALAYLGARRYAESLDALEGVHVEEAGRKFAAGVHAARASALVGLKRYADAIQPFRAYLALEPDGPDAARSRAELAVSLAHEDRLTEAKEAHDELLARHPRDAILLPTTDYLAEKAYAADRKDWARELFAVLARNGNPPDYVAKGLSGLAWTEYENNDPLKSAATFEQLMREHPESELAAEAALVRARALEKLRQLDAALAMYHHIIDRPGRSKQLPDALMGAARLHDQLQQDEEAALLLGRLVEEYPQRADLDAALYRWAWVLVDSDRLDQADALFMQLHLQHKASDFWADATYRLAERALTQKQYDRSAQLAQEIIQAAPEQQILAHALFLSGQAAARSERWSDVADPMARVLDEFPNSPLRIPAEYWIAESSYRLGDYDRAGEQFDQLGRKVLGQGETWLAMVSLRRAQVLAQKKQWSDAHEIAVKITEEYPNFPRRYEVDHLLGRCLASQAKFDEARDAYQRVIVSPVGRKTETAAMSQWMIGETHFHQKDYDAAIRAYCRVELLYDYPRWQSTALLQTGKCHEMKGQWNQAVEIYAQLLKQFPETECSDEASQRLRVAQQRATIVGGATSSDRR